MVLKRFNPLKGKGQKNKKTTGTRLHLTEIHPQSSVVLDVLRTGVMQKTPDGWQVEKLLQGAGKYTHRVLATKPGIAGENRPEIIYGAVDKGNGKYDLEIIWRGKKGPPQGIIGI